MKLSAGSRRCILQMPFHAGRLVECLASSCASALACCCDLDPLHGFGQSCSCCAKNAAGCAWLVKAHRRSAWKHRIKLPAASLVHVQYRQNNKQCHCGLCRSVCAGHLLLALSCSARAHANFSKPAAWQRLPLRGERCISAGRHSYVTQSAMVAVLKAVRDHGLPERISRQTLKRTRQQELLKDTALETYPPPCEPGRRRPRPP